MPPHQRFFAFIRAINIGSRRLTNDQLIEPFVQLGFEDAAAYQAAGNITFRSDTAKKTQSEQLEPALAEAYGFDPVVFVRNFDEIEAIINARPFTDDELARTEGRVQVSFLRNAPDGETAAAIFAIVPPADQVAFVHREWFWLPKIGVSDSQMPVTSVEDILGPMTMRTLGTITRMLHKFPR